MAEYKFITRWKLDASLPEVWEIVSDIQRWHEWWKGVLEVKVISDSADGKIRFAHTWRSFIPYKLKFITAITEIVPLKSITATATGELEGTGRWEFKEESNGGTIVTYYWFVRTTSIWMNMSAPFLSWLFRMNHDTVMRWGGEGLAKKLNCNIHFSSERLR
jgi:hypothetical protein